MTLCVSDTWRGPAVGHLIKLNREKQPLLTEDPLITQPVGADKALEAQGPPCPSISGKAASQGHIGVVHPQHTA